MNSHVPLKLALVALVGLVLAVTAAIAQNAPSPTSQPGAPPSPAVQIPTGRQGRGGYPLPALPAVFETYQHKVRVSVVARGLDAAQAASSFNEKMWETRRETFLADLKQRMRDIRQGPDGLIYLLTEEVDGAVLKIEPAE